MPLYEYRCATCGEQEEKLQGFSAPTEHPCPKCGAETGMRRQISVTSFSLAGGGWEAQGYSGPPAPKTDTPTKGAPTPASPSATPAAASSPAPAPAPSTAHGGGCACHPSKPSSGN